jgi:radical SAM protein with 4Fe4S-binding SPASM domain|tara:strand:+ start:628 stop:1650 length:1023 start_codon:yes stop_codon:yes gene_type:complete
MNEVYKTTDETKVQDYSIGGDVNEYLGEILDDAFKDYRKKWQKARRLEKLYDFPLFLVFEDMFQCNLKCIMCLHSSKDNKSIEYEGRMPWEMFVKMMEEASTHKCPSMTFAGYCEPLLDTRLPEMISLARKAGMVDIMLNTNATLLTEEIGQELIENGLTRLRIGFDGVTAETYEKIRRGSKYEKVRNNVLNFIALRDKLKSKLPVVRISCVHLSVNDHEIKDFVHFWKEKADYVTVQKYRPHELKKVGPGEQHGHEARASENVKCSEPWERLFVRGNGDVYICCQAKYGPRVGNLNVNSLSEIWNSDVANNLRGAILKGDWESIPTCKECMIQYLCTSK